MKLAYDSATGATRPKYERMLDLWLRDQGIRLPMAARPWAGICVQHGTNLVYGLADFNDW